MSKMKSEIDPHLAAQILRRLDILSEAKKYGFVPIGPQGPTGWIPGCFAGAFCGLLNVGQGPERGNFIMCGRAGQGCLDCQCYSVN